MTTDPLVWLAALGVALIVGIAARDALKGGE